MNRGRMITLEGSEGVGKSTNLEVVCKFLEEKRIRYTVTREPGGTEIAEQIRDLLLSETREIMDGLTELLLIFAARNQHLKQKILPELDQGLWVVSDRFTDASYAYQAFGRSIAVEKVDLLRELLLICVAVFSMECTLGLNRPLQALCLYQLRLLFFLGLLP